MATSVDDALANLTFADLEEGEENQRHKRLHVDAEEGIRLKKDSGEWFTVDFKYELLPTSCFLCGVLGHAETFCPKDVSPGVKPYNAELRAGNRLGTPTAGLRWIGQEKTVERGPWAGPDQFAMGVDKETAPAALLINSPLLNRLLQI
nr:uncharacterized protein LOC109166477 [Ipomoea batatas]